MPIHKYDFPSRFQPYQLLTHQEIIQNYKNNSLHSQTEFNNLIQITQVNNELNQLKKELEQHKKEKSQLIE
ncbi:18249_t:CDS:1, partial [Cetraspora pellucida]